MEEVNGPGPKASRNRHATDTLSAHYRQRLPYLGDEVMRADRHRTFKWDTSTSPPDSAMGSSHTVAATTGRGSWDEDVGEGEGEGPGRRAGCGVVEHRAGRERRRAASPVRRGKDPKSAGQGRRICGTREGWARAQHAALARPSQTVCIEEPAVPEKERNGTRPQPRQAPTWSSIAFSAQQCSNTRMATTVGVE
ncbi:MAG: hypothetical protein M1833_006550 [Piccolia ochrophora]|nr:MAG: hypothetical protein M1833_006550 [Piccolia ochrophora]